MAERWFVCASSDCEGRITASVEGLHPGAEVVAEPDSVRLRVRMLAQVPRHASVVIGPGAHGMEPVNLAASLVEDGHADQVILVAPNPSGSLRSRALRAGVSQVLDLGEVSEAVRSDAWAGGATGSSRDGRSTRAAGRKKPPSPQDPPSGREFPASEIPFLEVDDDVIEDVGLDVPALNELAASSVASDDQSPRERGGDPTPSPVPDVAETHSEAPRASIPPRNPLARHVPEVIARGRDSAPVLVVASGRGGVGKSSVVATAACRVASWGMRVAVLDLDLGSGNLFSMFGLRGAADLAPLVDKGDLSAVRVLPLGARPCEGVSLWGPCVRPEMAETVSPLVESLISILANTHDLVLVDTSTTWTDAVAQAAQACDRLLLVSDDRWGAVGALSRTAALAVRLGVARTRIMRASNRCDARAGEEGLLYRADIGLEAAQAFRLLEGGVEVGDLLRTGHARDLAVLRNDFSESAGTWVAKVLGELG